MFESFKIFLLLRCAFRVCKAWQHKNVKVLKHSGMVELVNLKHYHTKIQLKIPNKTINVIILLS